MARGKAEKGLRPPDSLITWIFQDDFIPRAKITKDGSYSIVSDHLGTLVEAYDEEGKKVWERELDIYGRVKTGRRDIYGRTEKEMGENNFIPFRFQGQYEDEEIGLYYNRFRYYDPQLGQYTQQDPIGLAGGNPTIYGYVGDSNSWIDIFGLDAASTLSQLKGKSDAYIEQIFEKYCFSQSKVTSTGNQIWLYVDGSEIRIHPYGNASSFNRSGDLTSLA